MRTTYASITPHGSINCTVSALERAEAQPVTELEQWLRLALVEIPAPAHTYAYMMISMIYILVAMYASLKLNGFHDLHAAQHVRIHDNINDIHINMYASLKLNGFQNLRAEYVMNVREICTRPYIQVGWRCAVKRSPKSGANFDRVSLPASYVQ